MAWGWKNNAEKALTYLVSEIKQVRTQLEQIIVNQDEAAVVLEGVGTSLRAVSDQLTKAEAEIIAAAAANGNVGARLQAAIDALSPIATGLGTTSQALDDLNADTPTP